MKKLITDVIGTRMTEEGAKGYTYALSHIADKEEWHALLESKLLEELAEYFRTGDPEELRDLIRVARALLGEDNSFSLGFVLTNEEEDANENR